MDFLPSAWAAYRPTWVDWSLLLGTMGFFATAFLLFLKFIPSVSLSEVKELRREQDASEAFLREHASAEGAGTSRPGGTP